MGIERSEYMEKLCENLFTLLHEASAEERTWWVSLCQAVGQGAADAGAGVRLDDGGEDRLPIDHPPISSPTKITRELLGAHVKRVAISA